MRRHLALLALVCCALARSVRAGPERADAGTSASANEPSDQRTRIALVLELAEALDLDEAGTLRLREQVARWDAQRAPVRAEIHALGRVLRRAAKGDTAVAGQVDGAIQKLVELRTRIQGIDQAFFQELSRGLPPARKASLALAMARGLERMRAAHRAAWDEDDRR